MGWFWFYFLVVPFSFWVLVALLMWYITSREKRDPVFKTKLDRFRDFNCRTWHSKWMVKTFWPLVAASLYLWFLLYGGD